MSAYHPEHHVMFRHQLIEKRLLGPMVLISKSTGARTGIPCHDDSGHDSLPCDSKWRSSLAMDDQMGKFNSLQKKKPRTEPVRGLDINAWQKLAP